MGQSTGDGAPPRPGGSGAFWTAVIFGNLAVILLLSAGVSAALMARFIGAASPGTALVVSSEAFRFSNSTVHDTVLTLVTPEGRRLSATWRSADHYAPDTQVPVLYRTEPAIVIRPVDAEEGLWATTWVLLGIGAGFAVVAAFAYLGHRLRGRRATGAGLG